MDQSEAALAIVEAWWKKSFDISKQQNDPLFSLITTSFETVMTYLSQSIDYEYTQKSVASLDEQRKLALQSEDKSVFSGNETFDPLRHLSFGMIEVVQAILLRDTRKLEEMIKSGYIPVPNIPNFNLSFPLEPKKEEIDDFNPIPVDKEINVGGDSNEDHQIERDGEKEDTSNDIDNGVLEQNSSLNELKNDEMMDEFVDTFHDDIDSTLAVNLLEDNRESMNDEDMSPAKYEAVAIVDALNDQSMKEIAEGNEDPSSNLVMEKGRESDRRGPRLDNYKDSTEESNDEEEPNVKKARLHLEKQKIKKAKFNNDKDDSKSESAVKKQSKRSETEMECIECEFRTRFVRSWLFHLRFTHFTTPSLSGLVLRCECGHESKSWFHSCQCNISNFTVIRMKEGPIQRLGDVAVSQVKCVLCEAHPKTMKSYILHLSKNHKDNTTLKSNKIYLLCACGLKVRTGHDIINHNKECEGIEFTLHKMEDEVSPTPQCILCEASPKSPNGYVQHLAKYHKEKPTLQSNGIYLLCSCGIEVRTHHSNDIHIKKKCHGRDYSLQRLDDE